MTHRDADSHGRPSQGDQGTLPALQFAAGDWIYRRGQKDDCMYVIEMGSVELVLTDPHSTSELRLMLLERGDFVGELGVLEEGRRSCCARAVEDCRLLPLDGQELQAIAEQKLSLAFRMLRTLAIRCGKLEGQLFSLWQEHFHEKADTVPPEGEEGRPPGFHPPASEVDAFDLDDDGETQKVARPHSGAVDPELFATQESHRRRQPADVAQKGRARLVAVGEGLEFLLGERDETTVGRSSRNGSFRPDIDLSPLNHEQTVSRRHATIQQEDGRHTLMEHEAVANGTSINGLRLSAGEPVALRDGDRVCFGTIILVFRTG